MHGFTDSIYLTILALLSLILSMSYWWRDVISEGTYLGNHTLAVQKGLNKGVALFIVSEALFFLAIFWAFFHSALSPTIELGALWPPMDIETINPFEQPSVFIYTILPSIYPKMYWVRNIQTAPNGAPIYRYIDRNSRVEHRIIPITEYIIQNFYDPEDQTRLVRVLVRCRQCPNGPTNRTHELHEDLATGSFEYRVIIIFIILLPILFLSYLGL